MEGKYLPQPVGGDIARKTFNVLIIVNKENHIVHQSNPVKQILNVGHPPRNSPSSSAEAGGKRLFGAQNNVPRFGLSLCP